MPWHSLVACYKDANPQVQRDMDVAVMSHAAGSDRPLLLDEHVSNSTTISREVCMKFSLVPESELERELGPLRSMEALLAGIPKTKYFYTGTSQQMMFYVFPRIHERPDFPVLKVLTANDARQHIQVMGPACQLYAAQSRQILEHLENRAATPGFSDPNERGNMVSWATFLGRKDKQSVAVNDPEMSLRKEGLEAQWMIDGGSFLADLERTPNVGSTRGPLFHRLTPTLMSSPTHPSGSRLPRSVLGCRAWMLTQSSPARGSSAR